MFDIIKKYTDLSDSPKFRNFIRSLVFAGLIPIFGFLMSPEAWIDLVGPEGAAGVSFVIGNIARAYLPNVFGPEK